MKRLMPQGDCKQDRYNAPTYPAKVSIWITDTSCWFSVFLWFWAWSTAMFQVSGFYSGGIGSSQFLYVRTPWIVHTA